MVTLTRKDIRDIDSLSVNASTDHDRDPIITVKRNKDNTLTVKVERKVNWRDMRYNPASGRETYPKTAFNEYSL